MIRINQIKIKVCQKEDKQRKLYNKIKEIIKTDKFKLIGIKKESIDARDKNDLKYIFSVDITAENENSILKHNRNNKNITVVEPRNYVFPYKMNINSDNYLSPVIIGAGPAGYFCALELSRAGFKPIVIERGSNVDKRTKDVEAFWSGKKINPNSNVSFGEGGAGTFSDGKLSTGIKDKFYRIDHVLDDFVCFGASEEIKYSAKPHIGTDVLKNVMKNMREEIIKNGGIVCFDTIMTDVCIDNNSVNSVKIDISNTSKEDITLLKQNNNIKINETTAYINTNTLVLAIGHSSRDTFVMLNDLSINMEPKAFAIGVRIEHKASMIDESQYGTSKEAKYLEAAPYKMTYRSSEGRSVYSFCMCPGGYVVNASSNENQSVVNGMSYSGRDGDNSNSAIVVNVSPEDFENEGYSKHGVLSGMYYQINYEKLAYEVGKGKIPIQLYGDFKKDKMTEKTGDVEPNIKGEYTFGMLKNCLPAYVKNAIIEGVDYFDSKLKGFSNNNAVLSGIESRTSSPVRIIRDDEYMSSITGLFPCGEGAGYAGGITSAAVDGIKVAEACAKFLNKN